MADITAFIDANVFYGMTLTDLVIELARKGAFQARWSDRVHDEWIRNLLANQPNRSPDAIARRRKAMDAAVRDALVTDYDDLIPMLTLPDINDRHVLAAAIVGECSVIVTQNLKDFPEAILSQRGLVAVHPDDFLLDVLVQDQSLFLAAVRGVLSRLKDPAVSPLDYVENLRTAGTKKLAAALSAHLQQI